MEKEDLFPLIWKNQIQEVKQYLKSQNPNEALPKDKYGCTALYWAIKIGSVDIVQILLEHGSDPLELNQDGNIAMSILFEKRSDAIFQLCKSSLSDPCTFPREKFGKNFLQKALEANENDWFQDLLPLVSDESLMNLDEDGKSILHIACANGEEEIVELILDTKPELLNHTGKAGLSVLHTLCEYDQVKICRMIHKKFPNQDWNIQDAKGNSCLHHAAENDATQVIEFLTTKKVDCTQLNKEDVSAFTIALQEKYHHSFKLIKSYFIQCILGFQKQNSDLAEKWIQFGKVENIFKAEDLAQLKIL